ncbi:MAG: hypothetical protein KDD55_12465 [Bdellovibrionales bacterium]|nr:hypothetical protein [Bdellovibrionales bacterium]
MKKNGAKSTSWIVAACILTCSGTRSLPSHYSTTPPQGDPESLIAAKQKISLCQTPLELMNSIPSIPFDILLQTHEQVMNGSCDFEEVSLKGLKERRKKILTSYFSH